MGAVTSEPTPLPFVGGLPQPRVTLLEGDAAAQVAPRVGIQPALPRPLPATAPSHGRAVRAGRRVAFVLAALWLFLSAIAVMKTGAGVLAPALDGSAFTDSVTSALGFGWIGAMLVMSGSPVAVSSLALLDGGAVTADQAFVMLTGSRLGAAFVVLAVAFIYALRGNGGREGRHASLSIGIFSLLMTAVVYLPALAIGFALLGSDALDAVTGTSRLAAPDLIGALTDPVVAATQAVLPGQLLFIAGLAMLIVAVRMFDRALPQAHEHALQEHVDWRNRTWVMFGLGSLVALVTMSVSVALTILVPAVSKGYFRRRQVLPYIMGANISTLGDTLLTAFIIGNPQGVQVVLAELAGTLTITLLLLALLYKPLTEQVVRVTDGILASKQRLGIFVALLFCVPVTLIQAF